MKMIRITLSGMLALSLAFMVIALCCCPESQAQESQTALEASDCCCPQDCAAAQSINNTQHDAVAEQSVRFQVPSQFLTAVEQPLFRHGVLTPAVDRVFDLSPPVPAYKAELSTIQLLI